MARQCGYFDIAKQMEDYNGFVYCRLGCNQSMPLHDLKMHEEVLCRFSVVSCPHCNLLMSAADLRDQHDCPKELVQCKLCNEWVENQNLAEHDKQCSIATTRLCPKGCGQYIPIKLLVDHKLNHCEEREIECEKCLTTMKAKELGQHGCYIIVQNEMVNALCAACLCLYLSYHIIKRTFVQNEKLSVDLGAKNYCRRS